MKGERSGAKWKKSIPWKSSIPYNKYFLAGLIMTGLAVALGVVGFFWTPYSTTAMSASEKFDPPSLLHIFGTDNFGRDIFSRVMKGLGTTIGIYGQSFRGFHATTASECDARIRQFLALDYRDSRIDDAIHLQVEGITGPAWFVLRTHNEAIEDMEGGSWQELEEGAYLIEVTDKRAVLTLKPADERFYR